jgi:hypothetical protein
MLKWLWAFLLLYLRSAQLFILKSMDAYYRCFYNKLIVDQVDRYGSIDNLIQTMNDVYNYVNAHGLLVDPGKDRKKILKRLVLQTTECAYFIQDISKNKSFCTSGYLAGSAYRTYSNQGSVLRLVSYTVISLTKRSPISRMLSEVFRITLPNTACWKSSLLPYEF